MWVVLVPGMTTAETGLPTKRTAAGTPWLMRAGTPGAHIHIPQAAASCSELERADVGGAGIIWKRAALARPVFF